MLRRTVLGLAASAALLVGAAGPAAAAPAVAAPSGFGTAPVVDFSGDRRVNVVGIVTEEHEGFDRVIFQLQGGLPAYAVEYVSGLYKTNDQQVPVEGTHFLQVIFISAGSRFVTQGAAARLTTLREVTFIEMFESDVRYGFGLTAAGGFRVTRSADQLIVDVAS
jgi:hypothetical protein